MTTKGKPRGRNGGWRNRPTQALVPLSTKIRADQREWIYSHPKPHDAVRSAIDKAMAADKSTEPPCTQI